MPHNNSQPDFPAGDAAAELLKCPQCGAEMERIETTAEGPQVRELQLCPKCYLVTWSDQEGMHVRQGVAMNGEGTPASSPWISGDPKEC